jgi:hypothetical protein
MAPRVRALLLQALYTIRSERIMVWPPKKEKPAV